MVEQLDLFLESEKVTENDLQDMFDKKHKENKLTPRQWALLNLVKQNSFIGKRKTSQREIYDALKDYGYEWNDDEKAHDHCSAIWNDIKDINLSYQTDKLIISKNFEYWIGDMEETQEFINKLWNDLEPRLMRYWAYLKKVERDGQCQTIDRKGNVIDEDSKARAFIESYGKERISD
jgi:hypothetical protein